MEEENKEFFPTHAITRAMANKLKDPDQEVSRDKLDIGNDFTIEDIYVEFVEIRKSYMYFLFEPTACV